MERPPKRPQLQLPPLPLHPGRDAFSHRTRSTLLVILIGVFVALVVGGVLDPFTVTLKLSLYAGLLLSSPVWLWQLWQFVTPGLYNRERRWALGFVGASVGLFAAGACSQEARKRPTSRCAPRPARP